MAQLPPKTRQKKCLGPLSFVVEPEPCSYRLLPLPWPSLIRVYSPVIAGGVRTVQKITVSIITELSKLKKRHTKKVEARDVSASRAPFIAIVCSANGGCGTRLSSLHVLVVVMDVF